MESAIKVKVAKKIVTVNMKPEKGNRIALQFPYFPPLIEEVKSMEGAKWHGNEEPPRRIWTIKDSYRNNFALQYLRGENPYERWDRPRETLKFDRPLMQHQKEMVEHILAVRWGIWAVEMRCGKTLAAIEAMERSGFTDEEILWIGPRSALAGARLEFRNWGSAVSPRILTYEGLKDAVSHWHGPAPRMIVFDEISRVKNKTAQRSQAAQHVADSMREEWGEDCIILGMSGTPAPKTPIDWWNLCEIVCPGFLKESTPEKLRYNLAKIVQKEGIAGGSYPELVTWYDDENKCRECGGYRDDREHGETAVFRPHAFVKGKNEVARLYKRMKGLVEVRFKKDCFSGNTKVITKTGVKTLQELATIGHAELYISTESGMRWIDCPVKSFGLDTTYPMLFGDHSVVRATKNHQWITINRGERENRKKYTFEIKPKKTQLPIANTQLPSIDWEGYAHGFVFGDGHITKYGTKVALYGYDIDLYPILIKYGKEGYLKRYTWDEYVTTVHNLPFDWKQLPTNPTKEYALGFVLGMVSADGFVDEHLQIPQTNLSDLKEIRELAIFAGLRAHPIRRKVASWNIAAKKENYVSWVFSMSTYNVTQEHLLRRDHKENLRIRQRKSTMTVSHIDWDSPIVEEVFCAQVPEYHNFTLENQVITGNCIDLPEKIYRKIYCKPSRDILNAAELIKAKSARVITSMILLRELSDGFQYKEIESGTTTCVLCNGNGVVPSGLLPNIVEENIEDYLHLEFDDLPEMSFDERDPSCPNCKGSGQQKKYIRETFEVETPKLEVVRDLLDEHEDVGRIVFYAGFTGSLGRIEKLCIKEGWTTIRADGSGWYCSNPSLRSPEDMLYYFGTKQTEEKIVFIGQPGAAGMGIDLSASPTVCFYSNDFNGESRMQAEERAHGPKMNRNLGCTIIDLINLPTDEYVLDNLQKKRRLQSISMGEFRETIKNYKIGEREV